VLTVLLAAAVALLCSLFGTPLFIRFLVRRQYGQFIRDDGRPRTTSSAAPRRWAGS
jgi:phospho-N-acetylmuramoyl-pentapeptide-transferase